MNRLPLTRVILQIILVLMGAVVLKTCDLRRVKEITDEHLKPGEQAAIIIGRNSRSVVAIKAHVPIGERVRNSFLRGRQPKPKGSNQQDVTRIDGARGVRISVAHDGSLTINARHHGFCFEPGIGIYTTTSARRLTLDSQLLFWGRHGLNAGLGMELGRPRHLAGHVAYSYNVWSGTSLIVGVDTNKDLLIGLRVKF